MTSTKRTVLITGCSDGGLGAAIAVAFHNAGLHVYATARTPSKMKYLDSLGIQTLQLDVLDDASIAACVKKVPQLDILINNAGASYPMPFSDISIPEAKKLFDLNVWSYLAVTQAFLPLLIQSKGTVLNQTSLASVITVPFQSTYNASKAAIAMFSDHQRLELAPFGITVIDLKTGTVKSNIVNNLSDWGSPLPEGSLYEPARDVVEAFMGGEKFQKDADPAEPYAEWVVKNVLKKRPSHVLWYGGFYLWLTRLSLFLPVGALDGTIKKITGLDIVEKRLLK
ncbi:short chain dehydrogenase [Phlyctema vagabunda]|uniref:Short chain dehydrogenase n=1 Tax=Phlyctema vagabunda TaxID=108571 RepID=A0ABR4PYN8_9HELO